MKTYSFPPGGCLPIAALVIGLVPNAWADNYHDTILADGPVAYYRLEEANPAFTIENSVDPNAFAGNVNFDELGLWPKFAQPGIGSNSVSFHLYTEGGTRMKSNIDIPYAPELNPEGPYSVECWAKAASVATDGNDWRSPLSNFGGWGDNPAKGWHIYQSPAVGGSATWLWVQKGGGIWIGGVPITKNKWDYLAAVFDGTTVNFYVNGVLGGTADASTALPNSFQPLGIGGGPAGNWYFDGSVDEVAIYNKALTVDQLQKHYAVGLTNFYSGPLPASITTEPVGTETYAGRAASFVVGADGTAPLSYQWYKGNTAIPGATSDTLNLVASYDDNGALYKVVVSNEFGTATSTPAQLTVNRDLLLLASPTSITRTEGSAAAFLVTVGGALPVSYQWFKNGAPITAATNRTYWIPAVQSGDNGSAYYAQVTNPWFTTNSEPATLSVEPRTVNVPITGYARIVMLDQPVGYWRLDESSGATAAIDAVGSFNGEYSAGDGAVVFGALTGIPHETNPAIQVANKARVIVPYALELNPHGPFSAEIWINPSSLAADGSDYRTVFSALGSGPTGWLLYQQPNNRFAWVVFNDNWVSSFIGDPITVIAANTWYHIVLTYDGDLFHIYVNGRHVQAQRYDLFIPNRNGAINFGWRSDNDWKPFAGTLDDAAFYNKALTLEQVQSHYAAAVRLTGRQSGENLVLSWPFGTLQEATAVGGPYNDLPNATSPYTTPIGASDKFFRVKMQ